MSKRRVLVVAPAWVGDMVMAQVVLSAIRQRQPDTQIDVLAPPATLPVAARMVEVHHTYPLNVRHGQLGLAERFSVGRRLAANHYDQAIVLPNSLKSALAPAFASIPRRTGFLGEMRYFLLNDLRMLNTSTMPLMVDRFMALTDWPDQTITPPRLTIDTNRQSELCELLQLDVDTPVLALCPGAEFGEAKRWPAEHFASVAKESIRQGMQVWLFGSPGDVAAGKAIADLVGSADCVRDLTGKTSLNDAIDLLAMATTVLCNDSGLMHVAAATGRKTLVAYGSTSPGFTPPLSDTAEIFRLGLSCSPCFERTCPLGHTNCLKELTPERFYPYLNASS